MSLTQKLETEKQKVMQSIELAKKTNSNKGNTDLLRQVLEESRNKTDELSRIFTQLNLGAKTLIENEATLQDKNRDLKKENDDLRDRVEAAESKNMGNQFGFTEAKTGNQFGNAPAKTGNPLLDNDMDEFGQEPAQRDNQPKEDLDQAIRQDDEDDFFGGDAGSAPPKSSASMPWDNQARDQPVKQNGPSYGAPPQEDDDDFFGQDQKQPSQAPPSKPQQDDEDMFGDEANPPLHSNVS